MGGGSCLLSCSHRPLSDERFHCSSNAALCCLELDNHIVELAQRFSDFGLCLSQPLLKSADDATHLALKSGECSRGTLISYGDAPLQLSQPLLVLVGHAAHLGAEAKRPFPQSSHFGSIASCWHAPPSD